MYQLSDRLESNTLISVPDEEQLYQIVGFPYLEPILRVGPIFPGKLVAEESVPPKAFFQCSDCGGTFESYNFSEDSKEPLCRACYEKGSSQPLED